MGKKMDLEEMDDDLFYDSYQLVSDLPDRDLLEQLAEESAELSQAALKLIRASRMSQNPTPISKDEALASLKEEANDVLMVLEILGLANQGDVHDWRKLVRWAERLQEANEEKEAANGCAEEGSHDENQDMDFHGCHCGDNVNRAMAGHD